MTSREDIKELFDIQIKRMLAVVDEQYDRTHKNHPGAQIVRRPWAHRRDRLLIASQAYLVLSGGLGSSPYVRQCLKEHYDTGPGSLRPNAQDTKIVTVAEP